MKTIQRRLGLGLAVTVIVSGFVPLAKPAHAQRDRRRSDRDPVSYCERVARDEASRVRGGVVGGAIEGAIGGAIIGGILGGRRGARRASRAGGALGAIGGGVEQERRREEVYNREFDDCMRDFRER